jgi:hypothetical protein
LSEEEKWEDLNNEAVEADRTAARFGANVTTKSMSTDSYVKMVAVVLSILLVPMQLLAQGIVTEREQNLILKLQEKLDYDAFCMTKGTWCNNLIWGPISLMETMSLPLVFYLLHLLSDSLLTFKTTLLASFGIYTLALLQMAFKSGRPFWDRADISSFDHCKFDFSSPAQSIFITTFLGPYIILNFFVKYNNKPNKAINAVMWTLLFVTQIEIIAVCYLFGQDYIFQMVLGLVAGFIFLVTTLTFDREL